MKNCLWDLTFIRSGLRTLSVNSETLLRDSLSPLTAFIFPLSSYYHKG